jgi:hypothetical protein
MAGEEKPPPRLIFESYGSDRALLVLTDLGDSGLLMEFTSKTAPLVSLAFATRWVGGAWKFSDLFEFLQEVAARQTADALGDSSHE